MVSVTRVGPHPRSDYRNRLDLDSRWMSQIDNRCCLSASLDHSMQVLMSIEEEEEAGEHNESLTTWYG